MINLIPPAAKKFILREYWSRVAVVWLLLFMLFIIITALLTVPAFMLVDGQLQAYEKQAQSASALAEEQRELSDTIAATNQQAEAVLQVGLVVTIMPYIERLHELLNQAVVIERLAVKRKAGKVSVIEVGGVAATRQSLTDFSNALAADPLFAKAEIPLSHLANNRDLEFSLRITTADPD